MFEDVLSQAKDGASENDVGRILIKHPSIDAIIVPLCPVHMLDAETVMSHIEKVLQSHEDLAITDGFEITVKVINVPNGAGRMTITDLHGDNNSIKRKRSLVQIVNDDMLCMARAIVVCWAHINKVTNTEWQEVTQNEPKSSTIYKILKYRNVSHSSYRNIIHKDRNEQRNMATALCELDGVPIDRPLSLNNVEKFENALDINILVVSARLGNKFIKVADNTERKNLYLYLVEEEGIGHFHGITSITGFFSSSYFCVTCLKPYSHREDHACANRCIVCKRNGCLETDTPVICDQCHMTCRSTVCFQRHKEKYTTGGRSGPSECERWWKCPICYKVLATTEKNPEEHRCGEYKCKSCEQYVLADHRCYLRALPPSKNSEPKFVFFDFECTQDQIIQCEEGYVPIKNPDCQICRREEATCSTCIRCKNCFMSWCGKAEHRPNFVVAHTVCSRCMNKPLTPDSKCHLCGSRCVLCEDKKRKKPPCFTTCGFREKIFQGHCYKVWILGFL